MAIAFDASSKATTTSSSTTWSHTCTGANQILFVAGDVGASPLATVTYNGVSMNALANIVAGANKFQIFYLLNPTSGANTISASGLGTGLCGTASSYTGVQSTGAGFLDSSADNGPTNTSSFTTSTSVVAPNCWLIGFGQAGISNNNMLGLSSNLTDRVLETGGPENTTERVVLSDSNGVVGTGSQSITLTSSGGSGTRTLFQYLISLAPFVPTSNGNFLTFI